MWKSLLKQDPLPWLLEESDPGVRYLALRDLLDLADDDPRLRLAREKAHREGPIAEVLDAMQPEGYWEKPGPGYGPKYKSTVWAIILLAQLGARVEEDERIPRACNYLIEQALAPQGQFSYNGAPGGTFDCLQGNLTGSLLAMGYADPRLEKAVDWLARSQTGEGVAPVGTKDALLRYYASKCGPNFSCGGTVKQPCAWGAVKVMMALGKIPPEWQTETVRKAISLGLDFLFSVDPVTANYPTGQDGKPNSSWWKFGFPVFYITDILQISEALAALGHAADPHLQNIIQYILSKQNEEGRWTFEYDYTGKTWGVYGVKKQPNKWVTLRALRVLKAAYAGNQ
jgi:hypothetical protein